MIKILKFGLYNSWLFYSFSDLRLWLRIEIVEPVVEVEDFLWTLGDEFLRILVVVGFEGVLDSAWSFFPSIWTDEITGDCISGFGLKLNWNRLVILVNDVKGKLSSTSLSVSKKIESQLTQAEIS